MIEQWAKAEQPRACIFVIRHSRQIGASKPVDEHLFIDEAGFNHGQNNLKVAIVFIAVSAQSITSSRRAHGLRCCQSWFEASCEDGSFR